MSHRFIWCVDCGRNLSMLSLRSGGLGTTTKRAVGLCQYEGFEGRWDDRLLAREPCRAQRAATAVQGGMPRTVCSSFLGGQRASVQHCWSPAGKAANQIHQSESRIDQRIAVSSQHHEVKLWHRLVWQNWQWYSFYLWMLCVVNNTKYIIWSLKLNQNANVFSTVIIND